MKVISKYITASIVSSILGMSILGACSAEKEQKANPALTHEADIHDADTHTMGSHKTGIVSFKNSCKAQVQADFSHAVALLHSFEYPESPRIFKKIIEQDPDCAMARWGVAMSLWHPLWAPPGEKALAEGAEWLAQTDALAKTPLEAAYIEALKEFFSSTDRTTNDQREMLYEEALSKIHADNPEDVEVTLFYVLAILSTADPRDKSYSHQFKAGAMLEKLAISNPTHPGVLHYLIHAYDFPGIAHMALGSAKTYASVAPDSAHAQHMPSHIFTRLGLWELSLSSNHVSIKSAEDYTEQASLPGYYDQGIHAIDYLMYAMLQTARDDEARELLNKLNNIETVHHEMFAVAFSYAATPARYVLERRQWEEASALTLAHADFPWDKFKWAEAIHYFARGLGAARSGKLDQARQEIEMIRALQSQLPGTTQIYLKSQVQVQIDIVTSWVLLSDGETQGALNLAQQVADQEDAVDKHPVTPGEVLPARELYADMLNETGNFEEALAQYRTVLKSSPNRLNALIGAARAARALVKENVVRGYENTIQTQTENGNRPNMMAGDN